MSLPPNVCTDDPSVPPNQEQALVSIMGHEANTHSIQALEKKIEMSKGDVIKLKRARNSLLNISTRIPPEILGHIFVWCLVREADQWFSGLRKGSYNFLLVCHYWFKVASHTPELWSFWGNTLQDWKNRHHRSSGATPLDLVLHGEGCDPNASFDGTLHDAVRSHVAQGTIRQVHLWSSDVNVMTSIISSLTPDDERVQNENIESIILRSDSEGSPPIDASNFLARTRPPKLRSLSLSGNIQISSWDRLASRTTLLTTLWLEINPPSPTPTASQLLSILTSNPNLQQLVLSDVPLQNNADIKVPLRDLKTLSLKGEFRHLFGLLRQLILPEVLDSVDLAGFDSTVEEISQTLRPYMENHFRRDARFHGMLEVASSCLPYFISVSAFVLSDGDETATLAQNPPSAVFEVALAKRPPPDVLERLFVDLIASVPGQVVAFNADLDTKLPEDALLMMPNLGAMCLSGVEVPKGFLQPNPDGPYANTKLLPSLRFLVLEDVFPSDDDWSHLKTYLAHQTSDGQTISLKLIGGPPCMRPEVMDEIKDLVIEFIYDPNPELDYYKRTDSP